MDAFKRGHVVVGGTAVLKKKKKGSGRVVPFDAFGWTSVDAGDKLRFSDATGFLGLEVLEGDAAMSFYQAPPGKRKAAEVDEEQADWQEDDDDDADGEQAQVVAPKKKAKKAKKAKKEEETDKVASAHVDAQLQPKLSKKEARKEARQEEVKQEGVRKEAAIEQPQKTFQKKPLPEPEALDMSEWETFGLHPLLIKGLQALRFAQPTSVQAQTLPVALGENRDVIGSAETGSGKTLAFALPIVHKLITRLDAGETISRLQALILTPTRELALQVREHIVAVTAYAPSIRVAAIVGGLSKHKQQRHLDHKPHIVVATPGRLWELMSEMESDYLSDLTGLSFLVLDEADRMVEKGHFKEVDLILDAIDRVAASSKMFPLSDNSGNDAAGESTLRKPKPFKKARIIRRGAAEGNGEDLEKEVDQDDEDGAEVTTGKRQTFVFSATIALVETFRKKLQGGSKKKSSNSSNSGDDVMSTLVERITFRPPGAKIIHAEAPSIVASGLTEAHVLCTAEEKELYLYYFLQRFPGRTLVFVNSISTTRRLLETLRLLQIPVNALHAQMQQRQRLTNFDRFKASAASVLIATDVAARGLDVPEVDHVVHFHLPRTFETYVHRCGRTARARREGLALLLVGPGEVDLFKRINQLRSQGRASDRSIAEDQDKVDEDKKAGINEFPVDRKLVAQLSKRVNLAKKISAEMDDSRKQQAEVNWFEKQAKEMDIELDDKLKETSSDQKDTSIVSKKNVAKLNAQLQALLEQKVVTPQMHQLRTQAISQSRAAAIEEALGATSILVDSASAKETAIHLAQTQSKPSKRPYVVGHANKSKKQKK